MYAVDELTVEEPFPRRVLHLLLQLLAKLGWVTERGLSPVDEPRESLHFEQVRVQAFPLRCRPEVCASPRRLDELEKLSRRRGRECVGLLIKKDAPRLLAAEARCGSNP